MELSEKDVREMIEIYLKDPSNDHKFYEALFTLDEYHLQKRQKYKNN